MSTRLRFWAVICGLALAPIVGVATYQAMGASCGCGPSCPCGLGCPC